jgi:carboxypeptidase PM20D1
VRQFGRILLALLALVVIVPGVLLTRTLMLPAPGAPVLAPKIAAAPAIDPDRAARNLSRAIRFPTISVQDGSTDPAPFDQLHAFLRQTYPLTFARFTVERPVGHALLLTLPGSDPSLAPMLLMAHQDVVPVDPGSESKWSAPPFDGAIKDGYVLGRGAADDKGSLIALLEASEALLAQGFTPKRTIMLAFGHDEEVLGSGAQAIAALLKSRGIKPWFALDEGMAIIEKFPLTGKPAGLIGIAEKGYFTVRVTAVDTGGHSSMPPRLTAAEKVAKALIAIDEKGFPGGLESGPARLMIEAVTPDLPFAQRLVMANLWLFRPLVEGQVGHTRAGEALMRTTVAPTMLRAGVKENVLPQEATAIVNLRLHPRDAMDAALARLRDAVKGIEGVTIEPLPRGQNASPVSDVTSDSYALIAAAARAIAPEGAPIAPGIVLGATDSRHFAGVAENVYRFAPAVFTDADLAGIHGTDERMSIANLDRMSRYYAMLMASGVP